MPIKLRTLLWRGDLSPLGCAASPNRKTEISSSIHTSKGLLRSPAGMNPLATEVCTTFRQWLYQPNAAIASTDSRINAGPL